jgi:nucleotide-binding universal stress UspA family protein
MTAAPFAHILAVHPHSAEAAAGRQALRTAADLARRTGAKLTLMAVAERPNELARLADFIQSTPQAVLDQLTAEAEASLAAAAAEEGLADAPVIARAGKPFLDVIHQVIDGGHDLVIKPAEHSGTLHRHLFTSTDQHLLRKCPCPVWLIGAGVRARQAPVLAAVDVSDSDGAAALSGLNSRIVETAAAIADFLAVPLHLAYAWDAPAEHVLRRWGGSQLATSHYLQQEQARHRHALEALIDALTARDGAPSPPHIVPDLVRGAARETIPRQADALGAQLLVMGTLSRSGVPGLIIGNTAEDVLNSVDCSVVTVKPPGYVSPVEAMARSG